MAPRKTESKVAEKAAYARHAREMAKRATVKDGKRAKRDAAERALVREEQPNK